MIWVWVILSLIHIQEARHEVQVIGLKNPYHKDYDIRDAREHRESAILAAMWLFCACLVAVYFQNNWWILPALIVNRRIFFDFMLIILMDWDFKKYTGRDWWMKRFKYVFGANGRLKELISELAITAASIIKVYV